MFTYSKKSNYIYIRNDELIYGGKFTIPLSNSKVNVPIINTETAILCPNKDTCQFSQNVRDGGKNGFPLCYAQKTEKLRPSVLKSHFSNKHFLAHVIKHDNVDGESLVDFIKCIVNALNEYAPFTPYIRMNESGDISQDNIDFLAKLHVELSKNNKKLYGYTKSKPAFSTMLKGLSASVLRSERDFVMVKSEEEAEEKGIKRICEGSCGKCTWCMDFNGEPIAVIGH